MSPRFALFGRQLLAQGEDQAVGDLEYDDEAQKLKEKIPYKTRGGLTPYAQRLHGDGARMKKRRQRKEKEEMTMEEAAVVLQTVARVMLARNEMLARVALNYQKVWNWKYNRYYFVNLRMDKTSQVRSRASFATVASPGH